LSGGSRGEERRYEVRGRTTLETYGSDWKQPKRGCCRRGGLSRSRSETGPLCNREVCHRGLLKSGEGKGISRLSGRRGRNEKVPSWGCWRNSGAVAGIGPAMQEEAAVSKKNNDQSKEKRNPREGARIMGFDTRVMNLNDKKCGGLKKMGDQFEEYEIAKAGLRARF